VQLEAMTRRVSLPEGTALDCGGFIKGWAVDCAVRLLPEPVAVDAGGDVAMRGSPDAAGGWRVDVEDPAHAGRSILELRLADRAVATSGVNRRRWRVGQHEAHHLIDPQTRMPSVSDLAQVTVVAASAELADVLAKTVFLRGRAEGVRFLAAFPDAGAILVSRDGEVEVSGEIR
jgi:thiamine biosynthesis lipoprotein